MLFDGAQFVELCDAFRQQVLQCLGRPWLGLSRPKLYIHCLPYSPQQIQSTWSLFLTGHEANSLAIN